MKLAVESHLFASIKLTVMQRFSVDLLPPLNFLYAGCIICTMKGSLPLT